MNKTLLVARREFRQRVRSRAFLLQIILLPLILVVVGLFVGRPDAQTTAEVAAPPDLPEALVGYVDQAGLIQMIPDSVPDDLLQSFADVAAADAALARADIASYYVVPPTYRETGEIRWVSPALPIAPPDTGWFTGLLLTNLLDAADAEVRAQLRSPFNADALQVVQTAPEAEVAGEEEGLNWLPFLVTIAVILPLFTSGGYLFQGLVQEKSSRVMEILLLSLRPRQLLSGKLLGLGALTLVQYAAWGAIGLVALLVMGVDIGQTLSSLNLSGRELLFMVLYALGGYVLYAALMAGIGAFTSNIENNRVWIFVITLPMLIPIYLWAAIVNAPNGVLAVALSLMPFSAPVAMLMRITVTHVPPWQLGLSLLLLVLTGLGTIWLMGRLFRAQTLLSGETLSLRRVRIALTG